MSRSTTSRGTKRGRTDFEPGDLVASLVETGTPVQAEWMDRALRDVRALLAPHVSYVSTEDIKRLTNKDFPPPYQLVTGILQSRTLLILVDVGGGSSLAAMVVQITNRQVHSAYLLDPSPSIDNIQIACPIFNTFVDRILTSTPPERQILRSAFCPSQESQADNGVVLFATILYIMSGMIVPPSIHVPIWRRTMVSVLGVRVDD